MKRRVLVVDDTPLIREHLRIVLEADDLEVETVGDGRSALARLREGLFHLAITDLRMPDMNGLRTALRPSASRTAPAGPDRPDRASATRPVALGAMKAGADDFVTKPYDPDRLRLRRPAASSNADGLIDELEQLRKQMRAGLQLPQHGVEEPEDAENLRPRSSSSARSARRS